MLQHVKLDDNRIRVSVIFGSLCPLVEPSVMTQKNLDVVHCSLRLPLCQKNVGFVKNPDEVINCKQSSCPSFVVFRSGGNFLSNQCQTRKQMLGLACLGIEKRVIHPRLGRVTEHFQFQIRKASGGVASIVNFLHTTKYEPDSLLRRYSLTTPVGVTHSVQNTSEQTS